MPGRRIGEKLASVASRRLAGGGLAAALLPAGVLGGLLSAYPLSAYPLSAYPLSAYPLSAYPLSAYPLSAYPLSAGRAAGAVTRPAAAVTAGGTSGPAAARAARQPMPGMGLRATLYGSRFYPRAGGRVGYQRGASGRRLEVHLWNTGRLAGQRLVVYLHGSRAGMMTIAPRGSGYLRHSSGVPLCFSGQQVRIRTRDGTLVASGTFRPGPRR